MHNWKDIINEKKPRSFAVATLSSCNEEYGNDVLLIFSNGSNSPQYVLKVVRSSRYNFKLERENFALTTLNKVASISHLLPLSYSHGKIKGRFFFIQSGMTGRNLNNLLLTSGLNKNTLTLINQSILLLGQINMAARELVELQVSHHNSAMLTPSPDLLKKEFLHKGMSDEDFAEIETAHDLFVGCGRTFFLHGDYWPANILVDPKKGKLSGIIDWEFSNPSAVVPSDIIWFLINLSYTLYGHLHSSMSLTESFKWGFFMPGKHNEVFKEYFQLYLSLIDAPQQYLFRPLLLSSLSEMAVREKIAYGRHYAMDNECFDLLNYAIRHESYLE